MIRGSYTSAPWLSPGEYTSGRNSEHPYKLGQCVVLFRLMDEDGL